MTAITSLQDLRARPTLILLVCLLLPLIGLGYSWMQSHRAAQRGIVWEVPVEGYDPRDLLRGHYVQFNYRWKGINAEGGGFTSYSASNLCLSGNAPAINQVEETGTDPANCPKGHFISGSSRVAQGGLDRGRLYVPQTAGAGYERQLADPKLSGFIRVRVDNNGALNPVEMIFRPGRAGDALPERRGPIDPTLPPPASTQR